jgi:hypothetical protein
MLLITSTGKPVCDLAILDKKLIYSGLQCDIYLCLCGPNILPLFNERSYQQHMPLRTEPTTRRVSVIHVVQWLK